MRRLFVILLFMIFGFGYIATTVSGNTNSEPADMESIEIICNDYLIEGEKLEISYNLYPENSRDRVLVYVICDGIKESVDISSGYLSYDYNKYNKKDFEVVIESRYNDVTAKKEITFISSDVIMIVVDNGEESGILKYYLREEEKFEYYEIDALKSKELYEKVFANSLWYYPDLKDSTYYFSEGLMTDKAELYQLYLIKDYEIQVIDVNYPSFITGKLKLTIGLLKAGSYEDIDAIEYCDNLGGVISVKNNGSPIGEIRALSPKLKDNRLMMQLKIIGDELEELKK